MFLQRRLNLYALVARPFGYLRCMSAYIFSFLRAIVLLFVCSERINLSLGRMDNFLFLAMFGILFLFGCSGFVCFLLFDFSLDFII